MLTRSTLYSIVAVSALGVPAFAQDSDQDGLLDDDETNLYGTDWTNPDTDGDTFLDGEEVLDFGTDPLTPDGNADGDDWPDAADTCPLGDDDLDTELVGVPPGLVGLWRLDRIVGADTIIDQAGGNHGTIAFIDDPVVDSRHGSALSFQYIERQGVDRAQDITVPLSPDFNFDTNDPFTVMALFRSNWTETDSEDIIRLSTEELSSVTFVIRRIQDPNDTLFSHVFEISRIDSLFTNTTITSTTSFRFDDPRRWIHLAMVRTESGQLLLLIDGVLDAAGPDNSTGSTLLTDGQLVFGPGPKRALPGGDPARNASNMELDEIAIFNTALPPTAIANIAANGLGGDGVPDLCPPCQADVNNDGFLDNGDIGVFIQLFLNGLPTADFNGDGFLDNGDIGDFIAAFLAGC